MPPPPSVTHATRPLQRLPLAWALLAISLLILLFLIRRLRHQMNGTPETEPLLPPMTAPPRYTTTYTELPSPFSNAVLVKSTSSVSPEARRHSYPLSGSAMAAEKAAERKRAVEAALSQPEFGALPLEVPYLMGDDKEGGAEPRVKRRRETVQIFATQDEAQVGKGLWRRRTLEFE